MKMILVVEDDENIGSLLVQAIEQETPYQARLVMDSVQALELIPEIEPSLLILDYQLPKLNGIQLFDRLQGLDHVCEIPTVMISARLPMQEIKMRQITGLRKPFELEDLFHVLDNLLG